MRKRLGGLSYANVMATIAVFVAIGGGAYAAGLGRDSVGSKQIRDNTVRGVDVKDDSLKGADIDESKLDLPEGPRGPIGPEGPAGPAGPAGNFDDVEGWQIIDKLSAGYMGDGSGLNADAVDGWSSIDLGPTLGNQLVLDVPQNGDTDSDRLLGLPFSGLGSSGDLELEAKCVNDAGSVSSAIILHNTRDEPIYVWGNGGDLIKLGSGGEVSTEELANPDQVSWLIATADSPLMWNATTGQGAVDNARGNCVSTAMATFYDYAQP